MVPRSALLSNNTKLSFFMKKTFVLIILFSFFSKDVFAYSLTRSTAEGLIQQMSAVIASKDLVNIEKFFKYYADDTARFIYKSIPVDPSATIKTKESKSNRTRKEYIEHLIRIIKSSREYSFRATLDSYSQGADGLSAVIGISIDERTISNIPDPNNKRRDIQVKTKALTNCNVSLTLAAATPIISGMNCIEKILVQ
jgi:hypothetical protein